MSRRGVLFHYQDSSSEETGSHKEIRALALMVTLKLKAYPFAKAPLFLQLPRNQLTREGRRGREGSRWYMCGRCLQAHIPRLSTQHYLPLTSFSSAMRQGCCFATSLSWPYIGNPQSSQEPNISSKCMFNKDP